MGGSAGKCTVGIIDKLGRIWKQITGKLNIEDKIEGFSFNYLT